MDKRMIGKWYNSDAKFTLNVFDEYVNGEPRLLMSFGYSGYYNLTPNCSYEKDGALCFELNDESNRMVYRLRYEDHALCGCSTQYGKTRDEVFERLSDVPEEGEFRCDPVVPGTGGMLTRREALKQYAAYMPDESDPLHQKYRPTYALGGEIPDILQEYDYARYTAGKSGDALAFAMLAFVCDHFRHNGSAGCGSTRSVEGIIRFCESRNHAANCRGLAILLANLLRLNGFRARHVTCCPYEEPFDECHVVVDCELQSGERIMFDPSNRLYYRDADGSYVSLRRLRELLIQDAPLTPNPDASHAGCGFDADEHRVYMMKNTFRFTRGMRYADGLDDRDGQLIGLLPKGYPPEHMTLPDDCVYLYDDDSFWAM